jgi:hypothetical protein
MPAPASPAASPLGGCRGVTEGWTTSGLPAAQIPAFPLALYAALAYMLRTVRRCMVAKAAWVARDPLAAQGRPFTWSHAPSIHPIPAVHPQR